MEKAFEQYCKECGTKKELVPRGKRKDGTTWDSFMGCPKFKTHPKPQNGRSSNFQPRNDNPSVNPSALVLDEITAFRKEFNERMDSMAKYFVEKLEKKTG